MRRNEVRGGRSQGSALLASPVGGQPPPPPPPPPRSFPLWLRILAKAAVWAALYMFGGWVVRGGLLRRALGFVVGGAVARKTAGKRS